VRAAFLVSHGEPGSEVCAALNRLQAGLQFGRIGVVIE
jgi:hypothetical protein